MPKPSATFQSQPEVVVVGSGAVGLAVAYELLQANLQVGLISPRDRTGVASWAAGAMIDSFGELDQMESEYDRQKFQLKLQAQHHYPRWLAGITERSGQSIFHTLGMFLIANVAGEQDPEKLALIQRQLSVHEEPWHPVEPPSIPGFHPAPQFTPEAALFMPQALTVDIPQLLSGLERALQTFPNYRRWDDRVLSLQPIGDLWHLTSPQSGSLTTPAVVLCAGAHSMKLLPDSVREQAKLPPLAFGLGTGCTVTQGPPLPYAIRTPNRKGAASVHGVPRSGDRVYLGANNFYGTDLSQPLGICLQDLQSLWQAVTEQIHQDFRHALLETATWGLRPIVEGDRPLVGATALPGLFVATGTHRTGVHLAPQIAELITGELLQRPLAQPNPFSPLAQ